MSSPLPGSEVDDYEWAVHRARAGIGEEVFDTARSEGRRVLLEEAVRYALDEA
jgi:hypothetical protein